MDPTDDKTLLALDEAATALGYGNGSALRRAAATDPPRLRTTILGKRHRFTTPAWLYLYETEHLRHGNYHRGQSRPRTPTTEEQSQ